MWEEIVVFLQVKLINSALSPCHAPHMGCERSSLCHVAFIFAIRYSLITPSPPPPPYRGITRAHSPPTCAHCPPSTRPTHFENQGTLLWCEYLSPWVLRKEFHTVLAAYGVEYLCSSRFQLGLGPEDDGIVGLGDIYGSSSGGGSMGGGSGSRNRPVDRTIFWNLVLHFREYCLPIAFLLSGEAGGSGEM